MYETKIRRDYRCGRESLVVVKAETIVLEILETCPNCACITIFAQANPLDQEQGGVRSGDRTE
jgi:hypothetical protein